MNFLQHVRTRGFALIEVCVAMSIAAIALLGLGALSASAVKLNRGAAVRSIATELAADLADRMRANARGVLAGAYLRPAVERDYATNLRAAAALAPPACYEASTGTMAACAAATDVAVADLFAWHAAARALLPGVAAQIRPRTAAGVVRITIGVREAQSFASIPNCPSDFSTDPHVQCFTVDVAP